MNPGEVKALFERYGVLQTGHFRLSSGKHSDTYLQCQRVLEHPRLTASLGEAIAGRFPTESFDVVVSPAIGGILIGNAVAYAANVRFLFTERADGAMTFRRGQALTRGERALVVEDVITTGGSAAEVLKLIETAHATPVGVGALVDRSPITPHFHLEALLSVEARVWDPDVCPHCFAGDEVQAPGSRYGGGAASAS